MMILALALALPPSLAARATPALDEPFAPAPQRAQDGDGRKAPGREPGRASPSAADQPWVDAVKELVREHADSRLVNKAKQVAKSIPEEQRERLLAQARQTWNEIRPRLGDDPARLSAVVRQCLEIIPKERIDAAIRVFEGALDQGGPAAAAAVAECVAKGKRELLPLLMQLMGDHGPAIAEGARRPEEEAQAWRGVLAAVTVSDLLGREGRETTRQSLSAVANDLRLQVDGKPMTLGAWARQTLKQDYPYLQDGPAGEDGMATFAAAFVAADLEDMLGELPLVQLPFSDPAPPVELLASVDARDDDAVLSALAAIEATVRLREAMKSGRDLAVTADDFAALVAGDER
jgi:hypothetical protein